MTRSRRLEVSKTISLGQNSPAALDTLRSTGRCEWTLAEAEFDADHPGHYDRRITDVSLALAGILGSAQTKMTLKLLSSKIRMDTSLQPSYRQRELHCESTVSERTVDGTADGDGNGFPFGVNDDYAYAAFEGAGVISSWHLSVAGADLPDLIDLIIGLRYTAVEGGTEFTDAVERTLE
ncbi:hypothetical protein [Streptomyces sp. NPDC051567]|uniref:Tc toxin subunit A-related protein n=1 Tax=Streptomyces sp. NPDC051567 TaxID=3365660 RepID=UPI0037A69460